MIVQFCTHGSNLTRRTTNLELEMFVTGEKLLKELVNTRSSRITKADLKTLRRLLLLKPDTMIGIGATWIKHRPAGWTSLRMVFECGGNIMRTSESHIGASITVLAKLVL